MRMIFKLAIAAHFAVFAGTAAQAETVRSKACRVYAAVVADDYMSDQIVRISDGQGARQGFYVAHVYGRKYLVPVRNPKSADLKLRPIGERTVEWGHVFREEWRHCLRTKLLGDFAKSN